MDYMDYFADLHLERNIYSTPGAVIWYKTKLVHFVHSEAAVSFISSSEHGKKLMTGMVLWEQELKLSTMDGGMAPSIYFAERCVNHPFVNQV
jgi:hypothetical protein